MTNIGISPCNSGAIICNATSQNDVTVSGAGTVTSVWEGGSISHNIVKDYGVINIQNNGTADKTYVDVSGTLNINRGGLSSNLLLSGGKININAGGVANDSTITTSIHRAAQIFLLAFDFDVGFVHAPPTAR
ncbi:hypothetical protein [Yersinia aldovae]|uniref:hypothetical protein n=1 Tax=Yersinia aldovae TaxID=29483 RepID=UPI0005ACC791|nr:hypothetical protein [Yersinia aldovae]